MRALEAYSRTDEGALYRFNWVFPSSQSEGGKIGFDRRADAPLGAGSYAFLDDRLIDCKLPSEHNDNPLFLLPRDARAALLDASLGGTGFVLSDTIRRGDLGHRSRAVFDALLAAYRGDFAEVVRHVQVERFHISKRYRCGAVTVEPQLRVDAQPRQLTADRSLAALPRILQTQSLFEISGPLAEGNRGIIEYNDVLKRGMEANKYLLATSEKGTVALETSEMHIDALLIATANEAYLDAFKQTADWPSYKGRLTLIRMPYLLDYRAEQEIYDQQLAALALDRPVSPHATWVAALWSVLTRLRRPVAGDLPRDLHAVVDALGPIDKAELIADGITPAGLAPDLAQALRAHARTLPHASAAVTDYEGRFGASPREMKAVVLDAVHAGTELVSADHVFDAIRRLVADPSLHDWLQLEPEGQYRRPEALIEAVRERYLDRLERETEEASGLVDPAEYLRLLERYVAHATHWLRGEKLRDEHTGKDVPADAAFLERIENMLGRDEDAQPFRSRILARVAAFRIDNPTAPVSIETLFSDLLARMRAHDYAERRRAVDRIARDMVHLIDGDDLSSEDAEPAAAMLSALTERFGYHRATARDAVSALLRDRRRAIE